MSQNIKNIGLLQNAHEDGDLSSGSLNALTKIPDIGAIIQQGLGVPIDSVRSSEVILLNILVDDSGSIRMAGNSQPVRDGHNMLIQALLESKQQDNIEVLNRYLNGTVLYPYTPLSLVPKMDSSNYDAVGGTPLFDETVKLLATVIAKTQDFKNSGIQVRTITLIMTDGDDCHSHTSTAKDIKKIVTDMLRSEDHIVAAMGFDDGKLDFKKVFSDMGIPDNWILTANANPAEIRKAFQMFSQSAVRASQSAAHFSQTNLGGFGG
ncbi:MAG: hypothetical protein ACD_80C00167G0015 [uncultured bacterium (gcode 4)]|uniref:VWFA domain-containing protein n=1 Tax=uncultured bacterium (gcode 4) TaxID=1234023 RepID=K1XI04_9BACT|nr:MAG: hypothetical protein ACD_80C00167G0015 [uncultured bacterium (gcode 4)]HBB04351.1 hypothetical protein [Candidatus Gracilibacteria bacterium]